MKRPTRIIILTVLLLVGCFAYGQEKEFSKIIEMDGIFRPFPNTQCEWNRQRIYLTEIGKKRGNRIYLINHFIREEGDYYSFKSDTIQNIPRHYKLRVIGKIKVNKCPNKSRDFELCDIIEHKPLKFKRPYIIDINSNYGLEGIWNFVGFRNSKDSTYLDSNMICCGEEQYKFETYDAKDSIFYPPCNGGFSINFQKNTPNLYTDLDTYILNGGVNGSSGGYCVLYNNQLELHTHGLHTLVGSTQELMKYEDLFVNAFNSTKRYSLNHNILTLYDKNSPRQMIFVRDEN